MNSRRWVGAVAAFVLMVVGHASAQGRGPAAALTTQDYIDIQQLAARYAFLVDTCTAGGWACCSCRSVAANRGNRYARPTWRLAMPI